MSNAAKPYTLTPAEVPPLRGPSGNVYAEAVADFVASGIESALIEMRGRKIQALTLGLRKAAAASGAGVQVVTRARQVYLRRV